MSSIASETSTLVSRPSCDRRAEKSRMNGATSKSSGFFTRLDSSLTAVADYFIPSILPSFRGRPALVVGIPVFRATADFIRVIPNKRFHENVNPGPSFTSVSFYGLLMVQQSLPRGFGWEQDCPIVSFEICARNGNNMSSRSVADRGNPPSGP